MNLYTDLSALKKIIKQKKDTLTTSKKIALLGESATQFFNTAIKGYGAAANFNYKLYESDFDAIEQDIFNPASELYSHQPDFTVLQFSTKKLQKEFYKQGMPAGFAADKLAQIKTYLDAVNGLIRTTIIIINYYETNDYLYGNYGNKLPGSLLNQVRAINAGIAAMAGETDNVFVVDTPSIQQQLGNSLFFDPKLYVNAELDYSLDAVSFISKQVNSLLLAANGKFKKCVVLDLDNTLWGGVIGDDGLEKIQVGKLGIGKAFSDLQAYFKALTKRGILLAVCSKNTEHIAKEPFEKHPDMVLRLEDIALFLANWERKDENIRQVQEILNIGFDAMVFIDDNPFERNLVQQTFPDITVPDLPEEPELYLSYIQSLNLFETVAVSENDGARTKQYQVELERKQAQQQFGDYAEYLAGLDMVCTVEPFNTFNTPRVAQLIQRSNQFNLRTLRLSEQEVRELAGDPGHQTFTFTLRDKFGDHGLIAVVIVSKKEKALFIDNWLMSCRVLKRGMEDFTLQTIVEYARANGYSQIVGEYIATAKNGIVKDMYAELGFTEAGGLWRLHVAGFVAKASQIREFEDLNI